MNQESAEYWDNYINHIDDVLRSIPLHKVTILTGRNGGGKSMIRKLLPAYLSRRNELSEYNPNCLVASTSMDDRAGVNPNKMMVFDRDCEWLPTSENTLGQVEGVLNASNRFLILDEIEIGMGEELQAGLAIKINSLLKESDNLGVLIITHSRTIVRYLNHDNFINLEGKSEDEWLNREIIPLSPDDMKENSNKLFGAFQKRLKQK